MIAADGRIVWLHDIVSVKVEPSGVVYLSGIMLDITKRKQAEDELRQKTEILQKIFDHLPVMVTFRDADGKAKLVNREWERTFGWTIGEIQERNGDILNEVYPDPLHFRRAREFIAAADSQWTNFRSKTRDGRMIDTSWAARDSLMAPASASVRTSANAIVRKRSAGACCNDSSRRRKTNGGIFLASYTTISDSICPRSCSASRR
jgi:PAS domain S-box-containing protein